MPVGATAPLVGLLYNPAIPRVLDAFGERVDFVEVIPDRLWYDFGVEAPNRFSRSQIAIDELRRYAQERRVIGHGIGLSLPSAMPLDQGLLDEVVASHRELNYLWYSEHLSVFVTPQGQVPNAQAGLGLPVVYDDEAFELLVPKLRRLSQALACRVLLENPAQFTTVTDMDYSEPEFLNRLHHAGVSGALLDLHNLYVCARNGVADPAAYLDALDLDSVEEVHLAGGDEFGGFYMDSHATLTPPPVWELARAYLPRCRRLRAVTFEYQESYFEVLGLPALCRELELMHELVETCRGPQ